MIVTKFLIPIIIVLTISLPAKEKNNLIIHYHRYDQNFDNWTLWAWLDETKLEISPAGSGDFGLIFEIDIDQFPAMGNINLLPKYKNWENQDNPSRTWIRTMPKEIWMIESDAALYTEEPSTEPAVKRAFLDDDKLLTVALTHPVSRDEIRKMSGVIKFSEGGTHEIKNIRFLETDTTNESKVLQLTLSKKLPINQLPAALDIEGFRSKNIELRYILDNERFYTDETPGIYYTSEETTFKVYAPAAWEVTLNLYSDPAGGKPEKHALEKHDNIWFVHINQDLKGFYYTYTVKNYGQEEVINPDLIDPYARAVTKYNGRGIIVDDKTPVTKRPDFSFDEAMIYEMHVRDFSISDDSGMKNKGKYLAFTETGTNLPGTDISTGIDHLTELGINTIQLLPVQDFEFDEEKSAYFWGYMPVNYNAPVGWYATKRTDVSPVKEFKKLVDALHKRGIKVVMDVVYNHTAEGNPSIHYNFNGFIPNFYYRQRPDGSYWNGSGCGNEMRSEQPMIRKYIIESLVYWVNEYKVDGFRFDLMGLHDMETMLQIVDTLKAIDPDIFIYGEPWTAGDTPINPTTKGDQKGEGFSVFNDHFRDALKGPWYNTEPGYIQTAANPDPVKTGIQGSITDFAKYPYESINYVAVHDGRTFWDQLHASTKDMDVSENELIAMDKLAAAIIFTSQGVPFIHGGQEMLRTKFDSHNSYNQPDSINMIRWNWKKNNKEVFEYYKGLIELRKRHPVFRKTDPEDIQKNYTFLDFMSSWKPDNTVSYMLKRGQSQDKWEKVLVYINPTREKVKFRTIAGDWNIIVDKHNAGSETLRTFSGKTIEVDPISCIIMWQ